MDYQLYTEIVLVHDVPKEYLFAGDVGTIVERHDVAGMETGYSIEFFNMLGQTVAVATLPAHMLRVPTPADRPTVRSDQVAA